MNRLPPVQHPLVPLFQSADQSITASLHQDAYRFYYGTIRSFLNFLGTHYGIYKRIWWRYWRPAHVEVPPVHLKTPDGQLVTIAAVPIPAQFDQIIQSWDMAFKDLATSDYVVGQVWGTVKADRYLLDQVRNRLDMPQTKEAVQELSRRWPKAGTKLVEDKANGPAVIQELRHDISGLIAVTPEGGKMARAQAVSPQVESGNVYLPHPAIAPWVTELIEEAAAFPQGQNDDQVDAMTQL